MVLETTGAKAINSLHVIQTLWSGYGQIVRLGLTGTAIDSVVLKYIVLPDKADLDHPRGWNTSRSHVRKIKSYDVEICWYRNWNIRCHTACRVAQCYAASSEAHERVIILEDLDAVGFSVRKSNLDKAGVKLCLTWLANFHAMFLDEEPDGLWQTGTYWHLSTRPDEWEAMQEGALKETAGTIDKMLNECKYQTLIHGDAKLANFCFSSDNESVAAVDFQYVGGGCGMKDVAYFLGSCLSEQECDQWAEELLDYYFLELKIALDLNEKQVNWHALKAEWESLFPVAWTDFYRFMLGWMPTHWKINAYSERLASEVIKRLS